MVVQADGNLDHRLQEGSLLALQLPPHVFQRFMGVEEAARIE